MTDVGAARRSPGDVDRSTVRLAWCVFGAITLCLLGGLVLSARTAAGPGAVGWDEVANAWVLWFAMFTFPAVGVVIATRQPRNPIGWVMLGIGFAWEGSGALTESYIYYGIITAPGSLPRPDLVAVITSSSWVPGVGLIGTFLLLLFPDGRLPSRRWRPFAWFAGLVLAWLTVVMPLLPASLSEVVSAGDTAVRLPDVANPLGVAALEPVLRRISVLLMLVPVIVAGSAASLAVRYRRARGLERMQLRWLAVATAATATIYIATMVLSLLFGGELWNAQTTPVWLSVLQTISVPAFALIPVAIGAAITRHRLYEIDRLVGRTVTYTIVVAALAAVYVTAIAILTRVLPSNSDLAVAASTLAAATVFRPLQRRVRRAVDRRFNRERFNAEQEVERFARGVREETDPAVVATQLDAVIGRTLQPAVVQVWTRPIGAAKRSEGRGRRKA